MAIGLEETLLVSIFLEAFLYGLSVMLYMATIYVLLRRRKAWPLNKTMLATATSMFVLATIHLSIDLKRLLNGFIRFRDQPGGPMAYFSEVTDPLWIFGDVVYHLQTLIGDTFVIYRLKIVWSDDKRVVWPSVPLLIGSAVCGVGIFMECVLGKARDIFDLGDWIASFTALTLAVNIYCTCFIAGRIWWIGRLSGHTRLMPVAALVIESGVIYAASLLSGTIVYAFGSWFEYAIVDAMTPIIAIVFMLVIVRVGLDLTVDETLMSSMRVAPPVSGLRPIAITVEMTKVETTGESSATLPMPFSGEERERDGGDEYGPAYIV